MFKSVFGHYGQTKRTAGNYVAEERAERVNGEAKQKVMTNTKE